MRSAFIERGGRMAGIIGVTIVCCAVFGFAGDTGTPPNPEADKQIQLSQKFLKESCFDDAVECAEKAVALDPGNSHYFMVQGDAYGMTARDASIFTKMSWAKKCLASYKRSVELDPSNLDARQRLVNYYLMAPGIVGGGDEKAYEQADEILKRDPMAGHMIWGSIHRNKKNLTAALKEYRQAVELKPEDKMANVMYGYTSLRLEQYGPAREAFKKVQAIDGDDLNGLFFIGEIAGRTGQNPEDGLISLDQYLKLQDKGRKAAMAEAHYWKGVILEKQGQKPAAAKEYRGALALDPKNNEFKQAVRKLGS